MTGIGAAWLSEDVLLVSVPVTSVQTGETSVVDDTGAVADVRRLDYPGAAVLLIRIAADSQWRPAVLSITIGGVEATLDLRQPLADLRALCRDHLAAADATARGRVVTMLTSILTADLPHPDRVRLGRSLLIVRDALRERLPYFHVNGDADPRLVVDANIAVDDRTFVVTGAMADDDRAMTSLVLVSPEGLRADLTRLRRHGHRQRPGPAGFTASCVFDAPTVLDDGWRLELRTATGDGLEVRVPRVVRDLGGARRILLATLTEEGESGEALIREHVFPALDSLQARLRAARVARVSTFGTASDAPMVSVIVPLSTRADLLEHQLAQFARDPDIRLADLVYVDDSSAPRDRVEERAAHLHQLYDVPFRIVTLSAYAGFAAAIDAGVRYAAAPLLVLLAPEALPVGPGWLLALVECHQNAPRVGLARPTWFSVEGTPRDPATSSRGAGLMIAPATLEEVGGLAGRYVDGESEAADLFLRLSRHGLMIVTCPDAGLYLLRAEPRFGSQRHVEARYDRWVRTHVHGDPAL